MHIFRKTKSCKREQFRYNSVVVFFAKDTIQNSFISSVRMSTIYLLDRLILKPVKVTCKQDVSLAPKSRVIYLDEENKEAAWTVLGYETPCNKSWTFARQLTWQELETFLGYQEKAEKMYELFASKFTAEFPEAVPLTARMNSSGNQVYFYFFAETRFQFGEFVKSFRQQIWYHFFLYQVGARDRVRLHPRLEERYDPSWMPLMYHIFKHPLPNVESDMLASQWLDGRSSDKIKDRSGKLDHTLLFEADRYTEESKRYPIRGSIVRRQGQERKCMWFNLLTQEIKLRGKSDEEGGSERRGERKKVLLDELQKK